MEQKQPMSRQDCGSIGGKNSAKKSHEESLKKYYLNPTKCQMCGAILKVGENGLVRDVRYRKFCNHSCSAKFTNPLRKKDYFCLYCGKILKSKLKYCNNTCRGKNHEKDFLDKWNNRTINGTNGKRFITISSYVRKYLLKKYNYSCQRCGWNVLNPQTRKCHLDIHHIDGNPKNSLEYNLELLCPNCHSLTPNYKYTKGQNRKEKSIRYWRRTKSL